MRTSAVLIGGGVLLVQLTILAAHPDDRRASIAHEPAIPATRTIEPSELSVVVTEVFDDALVLFRRTGNQIDLTLRWTLTGVDRAELPVGETYRAVGTLCAPVEVVMARTTPVDTGEELVFSDSGIHTMTLRLTGLPEHGVVSVHVPSVTLQLRDGTSMTFGLLYVLPG